LHPKAFEAAKAKASREASSLGQAISQLILQAARENPEVVKARRAIASAAFRSDGRFYSFMEVAAALHDE
jgi:hypothetical protein